MRRPVAQARVRKSFGLAVAILALAVGDARPASAAYVSGSNITTGQTGAGSGPGRHLTLTAQDLGGVRGGFLFWNAAPTSGPASLPGGVIEQIFDVASPNLLVPSGGTAFPGATGNPSDLSGSFSVGANSPAPQNGIQPGDGLLVTPNLTGGLSSADLPGSLDAGGASPPGGGGPRVGVDVTGLPGDPSSQSFLLPPQDVTTTVTPAPAPAGLVLVAAGAPILVLGRRLLRQKSAVS